MKKLNLPLPFPPVTQFVNGLPVAPVQTITATASAASAFSEQSEPEGNSEPPCPGRLSKAIVHGPGAEALAALARIRLGGPHESDE